MKDFITSKISAQYLNAGALTGALLFSFFLNFLFNAYLGRVLSFTDFGIITFIGSVWLILGVFCNALGLTINHVIVRLNKKETLDVVSAFYQRVRKKTFLVTAIITVTIIAFSYPLNSLFSLSSPSVVIVLSTLVILGAFTAANKGYLQSFFKFSHVGIILILESAVKFALAIGFTLFTTSSLVYLSIPLSALVAFVISEYFLPKMRQPKQVPKIVAFPTHFYYASVLTVLSTTLLFTSDVILAKLFLPATIAGQYAFLSLIGKMIYFSGSLLNSVMVPYISERAGESKDSLQVFYKFLLGVGAMILSVYIVIGIFGTETLPFVFGSKVQQVAPYLIPYASAIALFTLGNMFVIYHLLHQRFIFPFMALAFSLLVIVGITIFHADINQIVQVIFYLSLMSFACTILLHLNNTFRISLENRLFFLKTAYEL